MRCGAAALAALALSAAPAAAATGAGAPAGPGKIAVAAPTEIDLVPEDLSAPATALVEGGRDPAWSPDGTRLAYAHRGPSPGIAIVNADGTQPRAITTTPDLRDTQPAAAFVFDSQPAWSPDGTRLAFVRTIGYDTSEIWTVGADGRGAGPLMPATGPLHEDSEPRFLQGGRRLLFRRSADDVWSVGLDGRTPRRIVAAGWLETVPAPDGQAYAVATFQGPVFLVDRAGRHARPLAGPHQEPIAFAADGRQLLVGRRPGTDQDPGEATILDVSGSAPPRPVVPMVVGLAPIGRPGTPSWWTPPPPPSRAPADPPDRAAPVSFIADRDGALHRLLPGRSSGAAVKLDPRFSGLLTLDTTGVAAVEAAWVRRGSASQWQDVTEPEALHLTAPERHPGLWRLRVRSRDVLGHATTRPAEILVKLTR